MLVKRENYFLSIMLMRTSFKTSKRCTSLWSLYQRKTIFAVDVSVNQTTGGRWQTKLLNTGKVPQIHGRYLRYMEGTSDTWKVP